MKVRQIIKNKTIMWSKIKELSDEGYSKSKIARNLDIHRDTVRHYLSMSESEYYRWLEKSHYRIKKLDGYRDHIKALLRKDGSLSSAAIHDRLLENYPDLPIVSEKTVYNYVEYIRKSCSLPKRDPPKLRQYERREESPYGEYAQVDFGEKWMQTISGRRHKVYFMVMVLCRSRYKFYYYQSRSFTAESAILSHDKAFAFFGGQPRKIIYDQDSVFINKENLGDYILSKEFQSYVSQMDFEPVFCRPSDPESKGMVENYVKYAKSNFLKGREYVNDQHLNDLSMSWLSRTGNGKVHSVTHLIPKEEWEKERPYLISLKPEQRIGVKESLEVRNVIKDNTLNYFGNRYSLPLGTYRGHNTIVRVSEENDKLFIMDEYGVLIAQHDICHLKGQFIKNTSHGRDRTLSIEKAKKELMEAYPDEIVRLFLDCFPASKSRHLHDNIRILKRELGGFTEKIRKEAIRYCIENDLFNAYNVIEAAKKMTEEIKSSEFILCPNIETHLPSSVQLRDTTPMKSNINTYTNILNQ
jgi:transposase